MDYHVLLRLLLKIVSLLSFASCTLPARLPWNSSASPTPCDNIPIRQPAHTSDVTLSLSDIKISSSLSLSQDTNVTIGSVNYNVTFALEPMVVLPAPAPSSPSGGVPTVVYPHSPSSPSGGTPTVEYRNKTVSRNITVEPASPSSSPPPSASRSARQLPSSSPSPSRSRSLSPPSPPKTADISPSAGASRGELNLLDIKGIAIAAVIVVSLVILIAMIKVFKKKRAAHNDVGDSLVAGTDIRAYTTGQPGNPNGNSLEMGVVEIRTHTVEEMIPMEVGIDIRTYTMEELAKATNNFTTKVGQGVSGFVYRANLPGDRMGAVKRATDLDPILFKQELSVLLRLPRHPYLVDLIGLCLQPGEQILVFELISNGSLHDRLHKNKGNNGLINPLSWTARMDIAFQVAVALQYLHDESKPPILHRDVKSANVLLVNDNSAKLADFGLSKLGPKDNQFTITAVRGSYGYMDPQYVKTRRYSAKSDVYSFGVLLLELITGLKPLHDDTPLAEWTQTYRSEGIDRFMPIVDQNTVDQINTRELQNMIKIANLCLAEICEERCLMRDIVNMMQETRNINENGSLSDLSEAPFLENGNLSDVGATAL